MPDPLFTEKQKFEKIWTWIIIMVNMPVLALITFAYYYQHFRHHPFGNNPMSDTSLLIFSGVMVLIMVITCGAFIACTLQTEIRESGIHYRLLPFQIRYRVISWDECSRIFVRKYKPLGEYGGFGLRSSLKHGKAVNVSGNYGIQIELKTGKKILIGTQCPDEIEMILSNYFPSLHVS